ncbi:hypothetical protein AVEN_155144-1 [Araneus ventricosus]|uniref:Uncharacterized protein n=1 Tax=Araneus ventricosus TaxID=182803 RepID=A0A4Y2RKE3_ARAVE|nr:hypothetical protein AVEN_98916-1 [Araneus ventricosus]GBN75884.1 hypothetical protein AVEN_25249-1 [Araneus ventricosus]GBN75891.1 hypothetical protein AVEN_138268-1 [Araneus ventricosus]GBN75896.1 hypothetical protein AVEN_155144-1 [Araneus ventricosus]
MTRVETFGKVEERFASQQETRFSVLFLVRFPQAFITSLFQAFQRLVKSSPTAGKIEPPSEAVLLQRGPTLLLSPPLQSRAPTERFNPFFCSPASDVILEISRMSSN